MCFLFVYLCTQGDVDLGERAEQRGIGRSLPADSIKITFRVIFQAISITIVLSGDQADEDQYFLLYPYFEVKYFTCFVRSIN